MQEREGVSYPGTTPLLVPSSPSQEERRVGGGTRAGYVGWWQCITVAGMGGRNGQELLSTWVPASLAADFKAQARADTGGASGALRQLVAQAVEGQRPEAPRGSGAGKQVSVRLKPAERAALAAAAREQGTTPANWMRSLALVHLARRPQWNPAELDALREVFTELRRIGNNVNQVARALNTAAHTGEYPAGQGQEAREAAELIRAEMRRVVAVMTGNFDYWGLPTDERPTPAPGAVERADAEAAAVEEQRKRRPRRRPARFARENS